MKPAVTLVLAYVGFISLGLPDTVLGAAWPAMRVDLGLPLDAAGAATLLTSAGVALSSATSAVFRARVGTGVVLVGSSLLAAAALGLTALAPVFAIVMLAAFVAGLGGGAIDAALNDHVARYHGPRHMNWLHASWGIGAAAAPAAVAATLHAGRSWRDAYALLAVIEIVLGASFLLTRKAWGRHGSVQAAAAPQEGRRWSAAHARRVVLFFFYTGVEVSVGLWTASLLVATRGVTPARAGSAVALYWAGLTIGRVVVGAIVVRVGEGRALRTSLVCACVATIVLAIPATPLLAAQVCLAALGFFLGPVFPLLMHETPRLFPGPAGAHLVGFQIAGASAGVATLPWLLGLAGRTISPLAILPLAVGLLFVVIVLERLR